MTKTSTVTPRSCTALWTIKRDEYEFNALKIAETGNGPWLHTSKTDSNKYRDNFYDGQRLTNNNEDDKFYLNYNSDWADRTWRNGEGFDFQV